MTSKIFFLIGAGLYFITNTFGFVALLCEIFGKVKSRVLFLAGELCALSVIFFAVLGGVE